MPRQRITQRIDERAGTYRLSHVPVWLDGARYRPATRSDFTIHRPPADGEAITVTFNHGRGHFDRVGYVFPSDEVARAWIAAALASGEWHVRTN